MLPFFLKHESQKKPDLVLQRNISVGFLRKQRNRRVFFLTKKRIYPIVKPNLVFRDICTLEKKSHKISNSGDNLSLCCVCLSLPVCPCTLASVCACLHMCVCLCVFVGIEGRGYPEFMGVEEEDRRKGWG